jgi:hypothetical protein
MQVLSWILDSATGSILSSLMAETHDDLVRARRQLLLGTAHLAHK